MPPLMRHLLPSLALGLFTLFSSQTSAQTLGTTADKQARYIATYFPGRMAGSPAEMLAADYLVQQFKTWGYQSNIRETALRYDYTSADGQKNRQSVNASSVIAAKAGQEPQQVIIMAHLDTYTPMSDEDVNKNLGGIALQGIDDNAAGLGVMLELAERLRHVPLRYGVRFIATSGKMQGAAGANSILERMNGQERANTLLVIDLDSLVVGERLAFLASPSMPGPVRKLSQQRAISLAYQRGINTYSSAESQAMAQRARSKWQELAPFEEAGIPVLLVSAQRYVVGKNAYLQQRQKSKAFPEGSSQHDAARDNIQYLDRWLPGQIDKRTREVTQVMLPLVESLIGAPHKR